MRAPALCLAFALACTGQSKPEKQGEEKQVVAEDAALTFDPSTFCSEVFPRAEVEKALSLRLEAVQVAPGARAKATMQCTYKEARDAGAEEGSQVSLSVDCSPRVRTAAKPSDLIGAMAAEGDSVEAVKLGRGGAKVYLQRFRTWFLGYTHGAVPCNLTVEHARALGDELSSLVGIANGRLTPSNRPR